MNDVLFALIWIGLIPLCLMICLIKILAGSEKALQRMNPAEEAKYELHPSVTPLTLEITPNNVRDIIDLTIEDGMDHPALKNRKRAY